MQKVTFVRGRLGNVIGSISSMVCLPEKSGPQPEAGETWLVEISGKKPGGNVILVRPIRLWKGSIRDYEAVSRGEPDFKQGLVRYFGNVCFPVEKTRYAGLWRDYLLLSENMHGVIIHNDTAVRWNKKGKPPQVMLLHQFATKYKRQPLLGEPRDIEMFLNSLEELKRRAVAEARQKAAAKAGTVIASTQ
jgi:hypothetical protein